MLHPVILGALLLGPLCGAIPVTQQPQPQPQQPEASLPNPLQAKILDRLSTPRQWSTEVPQELASAGLKVPAGLAAPPVEEPEVIPTDVVVEKMNWDSTATDRFKDFLAVLKKKQKANRQQEMVPDQSSKAAGPNQDPRYAGSMSAGAPVNSNPRAPVNWGYKSKRSVIPKKFRKAGKEEPKKEEPKKEDLPEEAVKEVPKEEVVADVEEVELTNEDFDNMFQYYTAKHDTKGFESLQGHLDGMMGRGQEDWRQKVWKPENGPAPGTHFRRDLGSPGSSPRYSSTPENPVSDTDRRPAISINPEIFNRIAADYRFHKNPTTINNEDSFFGRGSASHAHGSNFGHGSSNQGSGRGKRGSHFAGKLDKRSFAGYPNEEQGLELTSDTNARQLPHEPFEQEEAENRKWAHIGKELGNHWHYSYPSKERSSELTRSINARPALPREPYKQEREELQKWDLAGEEFETRIGDPIPLPGAEELQPGSFVRNSDFLEHAHRNCHNFEFPAGIVHNRIPRPRNY
ncbi:hypothetical protein Q9L58_007964 [Maublancomyces gigas]|uniref:Uncharacterized protein n=1 Tax=Discina gigas TaxID=1032678 RepID=A0ABR3GB23_9PEZI